MIEIKSLSAGYTSNDVLKDIKIMGKVPKANNKYVITTDYLLQKRNGIKHINLMEFFKSESQF